MLAKNSKKLFFRRFRERYDNFSCRPESWNRLQTFLDGIVINFKNNIVDFKLASLHNTPKKIRRKVVGRHAPFLNHRGVHQWLYHQGFCYIWAVCKLFASIACYKAKIKEETHAGYQNQIFLIFFDELQIIFIVLVHHVDCVQGREIPICMLISSAVICHKRTFRQNHWCYS